MPLERYGTWRPSRFAVEGSRRAALLGVRHDAGGLRGLESPAISRWPLAGLQLSSITHRLLLSPKGDFLHLSAISHILQISAIGDKMNARRAHGHPIIAFASATSGAFEVPT